MVMTARAEVHFIIDQAIQNMQSLEAQARATGTTLGTAFNTSEQSLESYHQALNVVGRNMTIAGGAITGFVALAVNSAMNFEQQMSAVGAVSNATAAEMEALADTALRVGQETSFSATEVGAAMEILAKAGLPLADIINGVAEGAVRLSEATGVNITLSAETAAAAMTVFNLEASEADRVMNVIAQSANASMLGVEDWTTALTYAGPMVATLGYEIEDLAEWMVILGNSGIRGSVAATSLRNILTQLTDSSSKATEELTSMGISVLDAEGNMKDLSVIITEMVPHWDSLDEASRIDLANNMFGVRGGPAFIAMMNQQSEAVARGGDAFTEAGEKMEATGDIYSMSQMRMDNLAGSIERLKGSAETLMINFGSRLAPAIRFVVDALDFLIDRIANLPGWMQTAIAVVTALTGAGLLLGGAFLLLIPQIHMTTMALTKLGGVRGVLTLLVGPIRAIGVAFMTSLGPITLIAAAVAALYLAWKYNFLGMRDGVDALMEKVKQLYGVFKPLVKVVSDLFGKDHKSKAELDIKSKTDAGYDSWNGMADSSGKEARFNVTTVPDDMFIESIYDADGTVVDYEVRITSALDGTEQTGRILSSSTDPGKPDLIHMEIELASGETVEGTYDEITGKFTSMTGDMNVEVGATFIGDAYTIVMETLPDGTKKWKIIEDATGETFGDVIQSYTDQTGTTWIKIDGEDGPIWTKIDLATGEMSDPAIINMEGNSLPFDTKMETILMATGDEVVLLINGDDEPIGEVISGIMNTDGTKTIEIQPSGGGDAFWATVTYNLDGSINKIDKIEIPVEAAVDEGSFGKARSEMSTLEKIVDNLVSGIKGLQTAMVVLRARFDRFMEASAPFRSMIGGWIQAFFDFVNPLREVKAGLSILNTLLFGDWGDISWEDVMDVLGMGIVYDAVMLLVDGYRALKSAWDDWKGNDEGDPSKTTEDYYGEGGEYYEGMVPAYDPVQRKPYKSGSQSSQYDLNTSSAFDGLRAMGEIGRTASDAANVLMQAFSPLSSTIGQVGNAALATSPQFLAMRDNMNTLAYSGTGLSGSMTGAAGSIGGSAGSIGASFGTMVGNATANMTSLQSVVSSRATAASLLANTQFQNLQSGVTSKVSTMQADVGSRMATLQSAVTSQASTAQSNATSQFGTMNTNVAAKMLGMQLNTAVKLGLMASQATTQGESLRSNLVTKMESANSGATSTLARLSGIVSGAGASAAISALIAGQNIGDAFARGMESMLWRISNAASAMVAAANAAVVAKAMISSPSKLFKRLGGYMGEGVEVGILDKVNDVIAASRQLVSIPNIDVGFNDMSNLSRAGSLPTGSQTIINNWVTIPPEAWEKLNSEVSRSAKFVGEWTKSDSISQYLD